ncbi:MAG: hypothetical protein EXS36_13315 [Pedosphaera sp.]|nr:hypothetical protein [Pedosphaera sp.]
MRPKVVSLPASTCSHEPGRKLAAWLRTRQIDVLDTVGDVAREPGIERLYYPRDRHFTPAGAEFIGKRIAHHLGLTTPNPQP